MQIGLISEIRMVPAVKAPPADSQLSALFDIEATSQPDEDNDSRGGEKAAGAEEEKTDEATGQEGEAGSELLEERPVRSISYFA
jgi:hypothetical protein